MKVLFVSPAGGAYGSERSMLALLRTRKFETEVVCPAGGALERELQQMGITVHPLEFGKYSVRQNPLWHVAFFYRFRTILKTSRPQVVIINLDGNTPLVTLAAVWAGICVIRFCRFEFQPPSRWLDRWCWLKVSGVICPSDLVKQQILDWAPLGFQKRIHRFYDAYVGHSALPAEITAFRRKYSETPGKLIGYVGRLHRGKRIEIAIEALANVKKKIDGVRLLIIGGHDFPDESAYKDELVNLAGTLGVRDDVIFTGYLPAGEMPAAFAALDAGVLPSESESFGMVLMEAWAQGIPTVSSDIGGCCEITQASGGGYLAPVGDSKAFAEALLILLSTSGNASECGLAGKEWVLQNCSPESYSLKFQSIINNYISETT